MRLSESRMIGSQFFSDTTAMLDFASSNGWTTLLKRSGRNPTVWTGVSFMGDEISDAVSVLQMSRDSSSSLIRVFVC